MKYCFKFMIAFGISLVLFTVYTPDSGIYCSLQLVFATFIIQYWKSCKQIKDSCLIAFFANFSAYMISCSPTSSNIVLFDTILTLILIILSYSVINTLKYFINIVREKDTTSMISQTGKNYSKLKKSSEIFREHEKDIEQIKQAISSFDVLGIDAPWGTGKTFVVDTFCDKTKQEKNTNIVRIGTIAYSYSDFDKILVKKVTHLLGKNHVLSAYTEELGEVLNNGFFGNAVSRYFLPSDVNNSSVFDGLKKDLNCLSTDTYIVFEDLERVKDTEFIKKILATGLALAGRHIKVIFEYDTRELDKKGLNRDFREKYIHQEIKLTNVSYQNLVNYFWQEIGLENKEYKKEILQLNKEFGRGPFAEYISGYQITVSQLQFAIYSARRVKKFLMEVKMMQHDDEFDDNWKRYYILRFLYIKHFMFSAFDALITSV